MGHSKERRIRAKGPLLQCGLEWAGLHHWKYKIKSPSLRDSHVEDHKTNCVIYFIERKEEDRAWPISFLRTKDPGRKVGDGEGLFQFTKESISHFFLDG